MSREKHRRSKQRTNSVVIFPQNFCTSPRWPQKAHLKEVAIAKRFASKSKLTLISQSSNATVPYVCPSRAFYRLTTRHNERLPPPHCPILQVKHHLSSSDSPRFQLVSGEELITTYTFGSHTAKHTFCSRCGISPFYIPRSNPDGYDVNTRCLDNWVDGEANHKVEPFDGQNWEDNAASLKHLSEEK